MASAPTADQLLQERNASLPADWNMATASRRMGVSAKQTPVESRERSNAPAKERRKKHLVSE
jgi:hypothetical protein